MVRSSLRYLITFFMFLLSITQVNAQNTLDDIKIEQYLSTLPLLQRLEDTHKTNDSDNGQEDHANILSAPETTRTPITDSLNLMKDHTGYEDFKTIVTNAKFISPEEWASTGDMIMMAYFAYQLHHPNSANAPSIDEIKMNMQEDLNKISQNQFISAEQKQTLINKLENSMALLNDPNYIDNENISIISPYIRRLDSLFKERQ